MASEKFCLKWNDFENNISVAFRDLRDEKDFFDITLACEDSQIQAHKVILSACSPFFRNVLRNNPHQHPLIYLRGMKYSDLESVLNFMYHGEVNIAQEQLNSFLAVAEELRVKGLTQNQNGEPAGNNSKKRASSPTPGKSKPLPADPSGPPPSKRSRPAPPPQPPVIDDDDIQEVVPVKSEPKELVTPSISVPSSGPSVPQSDYHSQALVQHDEYTEENYGEYEQYDDQYLDTSGQQQESEKGFWQILPDPFETLKLDFDEELASEYELKLVKGTRQNSVNLLINGQYPCTLNTARRFPIVQWKCTKYSTATRCPVVFWAYAANHEELRLLHPHAENPLELAKDLRAIYKYVPTKNMQKNMDHNHECIQFQSRP